jgi:long-chain fatty acid transport protein
MYLLTVFLKRKNIRKNQMKRGSWKQFILAIVILSCMAFTADAVLAAGFSITQKSVKGLGNAFAGAAAVAEDASTIYFNPAGMTRLSGSQVQAAVHIFSSSLKFSDDGSTTVSNQPLTGGDGGNAGKLGFIPNFFYAQSISDNLKIGIGIVSPFGLATEYNSDWVGRYYTTKSELLTIDINPTVAYRINKMWSIGGGVSVQYLDAELNSAIDYGTIASGSPSREADGESKIKGDGNWGYGFNLGVLFELTEATRFGVAYRSEVSYDLEGDARFKTPDAAAPIADALGLVNTDVKADVDLPASLSMSGYHQLTDKWAVMADITWTDWSTFEELRIKFDSDAADSVTTFDFDDSFRYSLGATYTLNPQWTFRGGLAYDESTVSSHRKRTPRVPDEDRLWFSLGTSYHFSDRLEFDFGYTYITNVEKAEIDRTATGEDEFRGALKGDYDAHTNIASFQLSYKF